MIVNETQSRGKSLLTQFRRKGSLGHNRDIPADLPSQSASRHAVRRMASCVWCHSTAFSTATRSMALRSTSDKCAPCAFTRACQSYLTDHRFKSRELLVNF